MLQLITILNRCHHFRGFVYHNVAFSSDRKSIEIGVRPRKGSTAVCSRCHRQPVPGYDQLAERRFEFIPFGGFLFFCCTRCAVSIAAAAKPWSSRKFPGATASIS
jgi:transposase